MKLMPSKTKLNKLSGTKDSLETEVRYESDSQNKLDCPQPNPKHNQVPP